MQMSQLSFQTSLNSTSPRNYAQRAGRKGSKSDVSQHKNHTARLACLYDPNASTEEATKHCRRTDGQDLVDLNVGSMEKFWTGKSIAGSIAALTLTTKWEIL
jgi:hypothetical protein